MGKGALAKATVRRNGTGTTAGCIATLALLTGLTYSKEWGQCMALRGR